MWSYYNPNTIFEDESDPKGMAGSQNVELAMSFYHARYNDDHNYRKAKWTNRWDRNAGAVKLYQNNGIDLVVKNTLKEEYYFISYGNQYLTKNDDDYEEPVVTTYGHCEKMLMRNLLNDLIDPNGERYSDDKTIYRPDDGRNFSNSETSRSLIKICEKMIENSKNYKEYLTSKNYIIKMWSERPPCPNNDPPGGSCINFIEQMFPENSKYGYIIENYDRSDNKNAEKMKQPFMEFQIAVKRFNKDAGADLRGGEQREGSPLQKRQKLS